MTVKKQRDVECLSLTREQKRNIMKRGQQDRECAFVRERQVLEEAVRFPFTNQQVLCIQEFCIALNWNKFGPRFAKACWVLLGLAWSCWVFPIKSFSQATATKIRVSSFLPSLYSSAGFSLILCLALLARGIPYCLYIINSCIKFGSFIFYQM